ncbi:MAG: acyl-CoA dehydrogenase family protein [Bacteroidota bacterium]
MKQDTFQSPDFLELDLELTEEQKLIRDSVRQWVKTNVSAVIEDKFEEGMHSLDLINSLSELGCFGAIIPMEYGGMGLDFMSYGLMMQELERGDSSLRVLSSIQTSLVMYSINKWGKEKLKNHFLPKLAQGELMGCFGLTEPDHGSDPSSMNTVYRRVEGGVLVHGSKLWIGNAQSADVCIVWAKNDSGKYAGLLVDSSISGFSSQKFNDKWSFRSSETGELVFDQVFIPEKRILVEHESLEKAYECLNVGRYAVGWGALGIAMDCYDVALKYSKERIQFGKPIAGFQLVQKKLSEMITSISKAQLLAMRVANLFDKGNIKFEHVSMLKRNNVECAFHAAHTSREILGAMGITKEYPLMRHILNIETLITYQGTQDIHHLITGRSVTGISAFN